MPALARVLSGRDRVKRTLANWGRQQSRLPGVTMQRADVNGQPGALVLDSDGRVFGVFALDIRDGRVQTIRSVINPDKLRHFGEVGDMRAILEARDR